MNHIPLSLDANRIRCHRHFTAMQRILHVVVHMHAGSLLLFFLAYNTYAYFVFIECHTCMSKQLNYVTSEE